MKHVTRFAKYSCSTKECDYRIGSLLTNEAIAASDKFFAELKAAIDASPELAAICEKSRKEAIESIERAERRKIQRIGRKMGMKSR